MTSLQNVHEIKFDNDKSKYVDVRANKEKEKVQAGQGTLYFQFFADFLSVHHTLCGLLQL